MRKKDSKTENCTICAAPVDPSNAFVFYFNNQEHFFCESHERPFKMGIDIGQIEMNSKFISFISDLPDPTPKNELKSALRQFIPMTKMQDPEFKEKENFILSTKISSPKQLFDEIGKTVIGQDEARKTISVSVINHLQLLNQDVEQVTQSDKHHVLMLGKSGSGKTLIANTVANLFNLPFAVGDATNYSPTGFQGSDAESIIHDLLFKADMNFDLAERGIAFIDEIDKICSSNKSSGRYESFIGSTQSTLLKLVEGKTIKVPSTVLGDGPGAPYDCSSERVLFFLGGAFNGLSEILAKKMGMKERSVGFIKTHDEKSKDIDEAMKSYEIFSQASREDMVESLIEFGMLSELVGRIPSIVALKPLSKEDLTKVLVESTVSPLEKQKYIFEKSGYKLEFTEEFIKATVEKSYKSAVGTRALDSYVKKAVSTASFDLLSLINVSGSKGTVLITDECLTNPAAYQTSKILVASSPVSFQNSLTI